MSTTATDEKGNRQTATHTTSPMSRIRASAKALGRFSVTFVREKRSDKQDSASSVVSLDSVASATAPESFFGKGKTVTKESKPSIGFGNAKPAPSEQAQSSSSNKQDAGPFMSLEVPSGPQALRKGDSVKSETAIGPGSSLGVEGCSGELALRRTRSAGEYGQPPPIMGFRPGNMVRKVSWDPDLDSRKTAESFSDFLETARKNSAKQNKKYRGSGMGKCRRPSIQANERFDRFYSSDSVLIFSSSTNARNPGNETSAVVVPRRGNSAPSTSAGGGGDENGDLDDTRWDFEAVGFATVSAPNLGMMRGTEGMSVRAFSLLSKAANGTKTTTVFATERSEDVAREIVQETRLDGMSPVLYSAAAGKSNAGAVESDMNTSPSHSSPNGRLGETVNGLQEHACESQTQPATGDNVSQSSLISNPAQSQSLISPPVTNVNVAQTDSPPIKSLRPRRLSSIPPSSISDIVVTPPPAPPSATSVSSRRAGRFVVKATPGEHYSSSAPTSPVQVSPPGRDFFNYGPVSSPLVPATTPVVVCVTDNSGRVVSSQRFAHSTNSTHSTGILSPILSAGMGELELYSSAPSTPARAEQQHPENGALSGIITTTTTTPPNPSGLKLPCADPAFLRSLSSGSEESNSSFLQSPGQRIDDREIAESAGHTPPPSRLAGRFRVAEVTGAATGTEPSSPSLVAGRDLFGAGGGDGGGGGSLRRSFDD